MNFRFLWLKSCVICVGWYIIFVEGLNYGFFGVVIVEFIVFKICFFGYFFYKIFEFVNVNGVVFELVGILCNDDVFEVDVVGSLMVLLMF